MIMIEEIINELMTNRGYPSVSVREVLKNGNRYTALAIYQNNNENAVPCIYLTDNIMNLNSVKKICDAIEDSLQSIVPLKMINLQNLISKESIIENVRIGVERAGSADYLKRPSAIFDIAQFLYVSKAEEDSDRTCDVRVTAKMIQDVGLTEEKVWKYAEINTFNENEIEILNLKDYIHNAFHQDADNNNNNGEFGFDQYIITNKTHHRGAAQIFNKDALLKFAHEIHCSSFVMYPCSIHEVIITPITSCSHEMLEDATAIVQEINKNEVNVTEQLADQAYILNF